MPLKRAGKKNASSAFRVGQIYILFIDLRLKKSSTKKKTPWERLPKKATDLKVYACSDTDLGKILFHYVRVRFIAYSSVEFPQ